MANENEFSKESVGVKEVVEKMDRVFKNGQIIGEALLLRAKLDPDFPINKPEMVGMIIQGGMTDATIKIISNFCENNIPPKVSLIQGL